MAVITGAGVEDGEKTTTYIFIIHSDSQTFIRCFLPLYIGIPMEYFFYNQIQSFISILPSSYFSLSWCHHGEDTRARLIRGCHQVPTQMTHDHPKVI